MNEAIKIEHLFHTYHTGKISTDAINDMTLSVPKGQIFGFLGPNGAGKTTTIKYLLGIFKPKRGTVAVLGGSPSEVEARQKMGYMPENAEYYKYLTPRELLRMYGGVCGLGGTELEKRIDMLLGTVDLIKESDRILKTFSKGMKQRVSFAQSLINDPDLLILDEPTGGLDPVSRKRMRESLLALKREGKTIFFSSHELSEVELISDSIAIVNRGRLLAEGKVSDIVTLKGEKQSLENYFLEIIEEAA
ncbi:MAG TPA: ABC transporter ATP-binding protein [Candidatus Omnitrophota bacterium]|nr:ABC transporter ATP-binding protein [Candidatus Omnitrophota bacterium]HPS20463.1 ABC transporter ATP-binding protein [Candidatus Omnitrophota bacterium]